MSLTAHCIFRKKFRSAIAVCFLCIILPRMTWATSGDNPATAAQCTICHGELTLKYKHPPAVESCLNCHIEHFDKEYEKLSYNLQDDTNDLCISCHFDPDKIGGHPVDNHPTNKPCDPINPSRPFTCVSCHNPHQSDMPALFRYNYDQCDTRVMYPCAVCHSRAKEDEEKPDWKDIDFMRTNVAYQKSESEDE